MHRFVAQAAGCRHEQFVGADVRVSSSRLTSLTGRVATLLNQGDLVRL